MYFAIRLGIAEDGKTIQSITACDTLAEARKKYHNDLYGYIGKCKQIICMVTDLGGNIYSQETWVAETPEKGADE